MGWHCSVTPSDRDDTRATTSALGRYVVLEEVGRGGMGRVLRAYDPKLQREVALKDVRSRTLTTDDARRIVAEARAMAKLSHPNVVAVYDVEDTDSDRLVIVMEYVPGQTLGAWLQESPRPWREIVKRFVAAGQGIAAAHAAGLLHRDFKAGNVLVDGDTVKVTDFGLAKGSGEYDAACGTSSEHAMLSEALTATGLVCGTPRYMAPEQHRGETLTPAADQFAFCVALWAALNGAPPYHGEDLLQLKLEGPPRWAAARVPRRIVDALRRGLSPRPSARWPSMAALLEVLARASKRRHALRFTAGLCLVCLGAAGSEAWIEARRERCSGAADRLAGIWDDVRRVDVQVAVLGVGTPYATRAWEQTSAALDDYAAEWAAMHVEACEATERGEQSDAMMDLRMACLERSRTELAAVSDVLARADVDVVQKAHQLTAGLRPIARCADIDALRRHVEPPLPEDAERVDAIRTAIATAKAARQAGRLSQAADVIGAAKRGLADVAYEPVRTEVLLEEGLVLLDRGHNTDAERVLRGALAHATKWGQRDEAWGASRSLLVLVASVQRRFAEGHRYRELVEGLSAGDLAREADLRMILALIFAEEGRLADASAEARAALAMVEHTSDPEPRRIARAHATYGLVLARQSEHADAEAQHRAALAIVEPLLGPDHPEVAAGRENIAAALFARGRHAEAEALHREALTQLREVFGEEHEYVAVVRLNLGNVLYAQGKYAEAEAEYRECIALGERVSGPNHPEVALARSNLADMLARLGRSGEAEAEQRKALAAREEVLGPEHADVGVSRHQLGNTLLDLGRVEEAEAEQRKALALFEASLGPEHPLVAHVLHGLGRIAEKKGDRADAEALYERALAAFDQLGPESPELAHGRIALALVLLERGEVERARALAELAWIRLQRDDVEPREQGAGAFALARVMWRSGERSQARELGQRALAAYANAGPAFNDRRSEVQAWLEENAT